MRLISLLLLFLAVADSAKIFKEKPRGGSERSRKNDEQSAQSKNFGSSLSSDQDETQGSHELNKLEKEKEQLLKHEQQRLKKEMDKLKKEQDKLKKEQDWLLKEQQKLQKEADKKLKGSSKESKFRPNSKQKPSSEALVKQKDSIVVVPATASSTANDDFTKVTLLSSAPSGTDEIVLSTVETSYTTPSEDGTGDATFTDAKIPDTKSTKSMDATLSEVQQPLPCQSCKSGSMILAIVSGTDCRKFSAGEDIGDEYSCPSGMRFDHLSCACNFDSAVACGC